MILFSQRWNTSNPPKSKVEVDNLHAVPCNTARLKEVFGLQKVIGA